MKIPVIKNVQVQTHGVCNAKCVFCPYPESWHEANPGRMSQALWTRILDILTPWKEYINQGKFCPYLMQEPTIDPHLKHKVLDIYERFPNTEVEISTNGEMLLNRVVDWFLEVFPGKRHAIWVSHHGVNKQTYEYIMQINYERSTQNLINLLKRSEGRLNIRVRGAGQSKDGRFTYFTKEQYHSYMTQVIESNNIPMQWVDLDAFTFHDRAGTIHRTERMANLFKAQGNVREIGLSNPFSCPRVDEWVHIGWDGTLYLCCMDYHREVTLPNLNDMTLMEFYQSDTYQSLFKQVTGKEESVHNFICKRCTSIGG